MTLHTTSPERVARRMNRVVAAGIYCARPSLEPANCQRDLEEVARRPSTSATTWDVARPLRRRDSPRLRNNCVTDRVADDDPSCGGAYPYRCRYFRVAVPHDGALVVTIRWNCPASYPFDLGVYGPTGPVADGQIGVGLDRTARGRVIGGTTYLIEVWSFLTPSASFELSTSIEPR